MSKKFALQQSQRNRRAIQFGENIIATRTEAVDGPRDQFFPRPCFPLNQNRGLHRRNGFDLPQHLPQPGTVAKNVFKVMLGADFIPQVKSLFSQPILRLAQFAELQRILQRDPHLARHLPQEFDILL